MTYSSYFSTPVNDVAAATTSQETAPATQYAGYAEFMSNLNDSNWLYFVSSDEEIFAPVTLTAFKRREDARNLKRQLSATNPNENFFIQRFSVSIFNDNLNVITRLCCLIYFL